MQIIPYEQQYAAQIAGLLNRYMPFQPEDAKTVHEAGGIRYIAIIDEQVVGYIAGYEMKDINDDFPYFEVELTSLKDQIRSIKAVYTSHFVVNPNFRMRGIGTLLVKKYVNEAKKIAELIVVVGWVQSDTKKWAAERQFLAQGFTSYRYIHEYFKPYTVYCPNCKGLCHCDAHIVVLQTNSTTSPLT